MECLKTNIRDVIRRELLLTKKLKELGLTSADITALTKKDGGAGSSASMVHSALAVPSISDNTNGELRSTEYNIAQVVPFPSKPNYYQ